MDIAKQQAAFARERLKHDLYDRRYAIYLAFEKMLRASMGQKGIGEEGQTLLDANIAAHQANFILSDELGKYLAELHDLCWRKHAKLAPEIFRELPNEEKQKIAYQNRDDTKAILRSPAILVAKFKPFLKLKDFREIEDNQQA